MFIYDYPMTLEEVSDRSTDYLKARIKAQDLDPDTLNIVENELSKRLEVKQWAAILLTDHIEMQVSHLCQFVITICYT